MISRAKFYGGSRHIKQGARVGLTEKFTVSLDVRFTDCQATRSASYVPNAFLKHLSTIPTPRLGMRVVVVYHKSSVNPNATMLVKKSDGTSIGTVAKGSAMVLTLVGDVTGVGTWRKATRSVLAQEAP